MLGLVLRHEPARRVEQEAIVRCVVAPLARPARTGRGVGVGTAEPGGRGGGAAVRRIAPLVVAAGMRLAGVLGGR